MPIVFYSLGGLLVASGGIWALFSLVNAMRLGQFGGLIAVVVAAIYIALAGALFVGLGAIIERLDRIAANTRSRASAASLRDDRR